jgi:hypothetical protein
MKLNHKIPCHLRALYMHNLGIMTFHCTSTQLWNQAHNRRRLRPFQQKLTPSKKCWPSGKTFGELFVRKRMMHGLLATAVILGRETFTLLQTERESITWKSFKWNLPRGVLKCALNATQCGKSVPHGRKLAKATFTPLNHLQRAANQPPMEKN